MKKRLTISINIDGDNTLTPGEVWPDGNAPEVVTAEAVMERIKEDCSSVSDLINDWSLDCCVYVVVEEDDRHEVEDWMP